MNVQNKYAPLLQPINIGSMEVKNRFFMGPMLMNWHVDNRGAFTDQAIEFYLERARGGFGAIFTGAQLTDDDVDPIMKQMSGREVFTHHPEHFIAQGKKLTDELKAYNTKMILELGFGVGRNYPMIKAPSAVPAYHYPTMIATPLTRSEIRFKEQELIKGAAIGREAGFDAVDIHSLHWGYLLDQFALAITNHRTDEYGGSLENRLRMTRETVEGIQRECGKDFPITIGLHVKSFIKALNQASLNGEDEAGRTVEEAIEIAKELEKMGVSAIMTDVGIYDSFYHACPPSYMPKGHGLSYYKQLKDAVNIPILARSRMGDADLCLNALENGQADAVVMARPALADPFFPNKVASGEIASIRPCIGCNMGCIGRCLELGEHESCAANPRACFEYEHPDKKTASPKKIAIVGGGAAGMQAALTAVDCGHKAEIFEITDHLGGELNAAGAHEDKVDIHHLRDWFIREVKANEVPVHLCTAFTPELCKAGGFDTVIMASGACSVTPRSIPGIEKAITAVDLLENAKEPGERVVVVGGGMVGCETAVDLAKKGKKVSLVEMAPAILEQGFVPQQHKGMLKDMLSAYGVDVYVDYKLAEVTDESAVIEVDKKMFTLGARDEVTSSLTAGDRLTIPADCVVLSMGLRPNEKNTAELEALGVKVVEVGSAVKAGNVLDATHDAYEAVYALD